MLPVTIIRRLKLKIVDYTILKAHPQCHSTLEEKVSVSLDSGYKPLGGPFFDGSFLCQAMILHGKNAVSGVSKADYSDIDDEECTPLSL